MKKIALALAVMLIALTCTAGAANTQVYRKVKTENKRIALTFDDGPHPRYTAEILDLLREYNVRATFFVIGENIEYYDKNIISQMLLDGHEIGNHTFTHAHTKEMSEQKFIADVEKCHNLVLERYGYEMKLFRPPEGYVDKKVGEVANKLGYSVILWSIDTRDWEHTASSTIVGNVERSVSGGDIILMHDYVSKPSTTTTALRELIPELLSRGYEFVTVSDLISQP